MSGTRLLLASASLPSTREVHVKKPYTKPILTNLGKQPPIKHREHACALPSANLGHERQGSEPRADAQRAKPIEEFPAAGS